MTLTEALSGSRLAGAERSAGGITALIHRSRQGYHLTRCTPDDAGRSQPQRWVFPHSLRPAGVCPRPRVHRGGCGGHRLAGPVSGSP